MNELAEREREVLCSVDQNRIRGDQVVDRNTHARAQKKNIKKIGEWWPCSP